MNKDYNYYLFSFFPYKQDDTNSNLDLSEARASLLSGDVIELTNATSVESTATKLTWDVSI
jgi:hypothetical protein